MWLSKITESLTEYGKTHNAHNYKYLYHQTARLQWLRLLQ